MTDPCDLLATAMERLRHDYRCQASPDGRSLVLSTGRYYADGDAVEVVARVSEDGHRLAVSDGGLTRARREMTTGADMSGRAKRLWADIVTEFGVLEIEDRIYARGPIEDGAQLVAQVADAILTLDSVKLLSEQERETFTARLQRFLAVETEVTLVDDRTISNRFGDAQQVTAVVETERGHIAVQGAGGFTTGSVRTAADHAHFIFTGLTESEWPLANRLVVLERTNTGRRSSAGTPSLVSRLAEVSYVCSFESKIPIKRFLTELPLPNRDLVTVPFGQQGLTL